MIYLRRISADNRGNVSIDIEALECGDRLEYFTCKGYKVVTKDQYITAWRGNDTRIQAIQEIERILQDRVVGETYHIKKGN